MLDHSSISVLDYEASLAFYDQTMECIGYERVMTLDIPEKRVQAAGYGISPKPTFWISPMGKEEESVGSARGVHFAFLAPSQSAVDLWYETALKLGAKDNGKPGPRPEYHPGYYGAFVIDPNGWRIEAVYHEYST